jgi:hypothetical protein
MTSSRCLEDLQVWTEQFGFRIIDSLRITVLESYDSLTGVAE